MIQSSRSLCGACTEMQCTALDGWVAAAWVLMFSFTNTSRLYVSTLRQIVDVELKSRRNRNNLNIQ